MPSSADLREMIDRRTAFLARVGSMPPFLRLFVCGFWLMAIFLACSTLLPGWTDDQGRPIPTTEAWRNGDAPTNLLVASVLCGLAALFYLRSSFARPAALIAFVGGWISGVALDRPLGLPPHVELIAGCVSFAVLYLYLYRNPSVQGYLGQPGSDTRQAATSAKDR